MIYFKRAAVYLAMGQAKKAIPDLDKSVELKKDFHHVSVRSSIVLLQVHIYMYMYINHTFMPSTELRVCVLNKQYNNYMYMYNLLTFNIILCIL